LFLVVHDIPGGEIGEALEEAAERVRLLATPIGALFLASFVRIDRRQAFTIFQAENASQVRRACEVGGLSVVEVLDGQRMTDRLALSFGAEKHGRPDGESS
jgi:hypothetical protein